MKKKLIENKKIILSCFFLFILFLFWNLIVQRVVLDEVWNYGFSVSMYKGLLPYRDFNMVITPFFNFLFSIPFHLFGSNILVFHIEQALMLAIMSFFLFKLLDKKAWLVIMILFFPMSIIYPSYNCFCLFLTIFLIYLEKNNKNDYLIGLLIGLAILSKQSVGLCLVLPSLFYINKKEKIIKHLIGMIIPIFVFIIYLVTTNTFNNFFDLCVLGLFDFADKNKRPVTLSLLMLVPSIVGVIYLIYKDKRNICNYYALAFCSMALPLLDFFHCQFVFLIFLTVLLMRFDNIKLNIKLFSFSIILFCIIMNFSVQIKDGFIYPNNINHFEYRYINKNDSKICNEMNTFINKHKDSKIVILSADAYLYKLSNDIDLNYLDLINTGNWGYNGSEKLLNEIKKNKDALYLVNDDEVKSNNQTDKKALKYVINNSKKIGNVYHFSVYKFK